VSGEGFLREIEQQMAMARPWDHAEGESVWEITGQYPDGGSFVKCLAFTLPGYMTGTDEPLFVFIGLLADLNRAVPPSWITHAEPLLLVHRDDPTEPYWEQDRVWMREA
jgi:hypothetical protein